MKDKLDQLVIELISQCNEHCIHCYIPDSRKKFSLKFELLKHLFEQAKCNKIKKIVFTGGEIFLHPEIIQILNYANDCGFKIRVFSNLTILSKEHLSLLLKIKPQLIQTSIYSIDPVIHDLITQKKGSLNRTMKNIFLLRKANVPVEISCPVTTINRDYFVHVLEWTIKMNLKFYCDFSIIGTQDLLASNIKFRLNVEEEAKLQTILFNLSPWKMKKHTSPTSSDKIYPNGIGSLTISAEGNYIPSVLMVDKILGNIRDDKINDLWRNAPFLNFLRNLEYSNFSECMECKAIEYCPKCYDAHYLETGNYYVLCNRLCDSIRLIKNVTVNKSKTMEIINN